MNSTIAGSMNACMPVSFYCEIWSKLV